MIKLFVILFVQVLNEKPDACLKRLNLSQLNHSVLSALAKLGPVQEEGSRQVLSKALNVLDNK